MGKEGKRGAGGDQSVKATFAAGLRRAVCLATGSVESYEWLQTAQDCVFFRAPPTFCSVLTLKEHNKEEPSAITRASAYQRISAAQCRSVA